MKVTGIGLCPPPGARDNPQVTPELLASCLARYSRSNKGIDAILGTIDWNDPEKSVDSIFKFVDYGHASITGLTGGIAIAIDGCSMFLAYKLFEIAQLSDGQESSTRYIKLDESNLPEPEEVGIPSDLADEWKAYLRLAFGIYHDVYKDLDQQAIANPDLIKLPPDVDPKIADRIRKNYALDRARYFIPFATKTNAAYVMTARVWADTVRQLDSLPNPEAKQCAAMIRLELEKFVPRMIKHSQPNDSTLEQADQLISYVTKQIVENGIPTQRLDDKLYMSIEKSAPSFLLDYQSFEQAFRGKINRYSINGEAIKRIFTRVAWNNMAIAELRDLNRHRSGFRLSTLQPVGFYLPSKIQHAKVTELLTAKRQIIEKLALSKSRGSFVYALLLGTQTPFEHSTYLDKMIYEIELRTGLGAHFRYAEHLNAAYNELVRQMPELRPYIQLGNAEPEF